MASESWKQRHAARLRAGLEFIAQSQTTTRAEVVTRVEQAVPPTDDERTIIPSNGRERWLYQFLWATTGLSKAGYIDKDGRGTWTITPDGNAVLASTKDPIEFLSAVDHRYKEWHLKWKAARSNNIRRAWLLRGTSVLGSNVVPEWLANGFVSVAGAQRTTSRHNR